MEIGIFGVGLFVGISLWFPYKHVLNRMVAKKRETSAILNELGLSEREHAETMRWGQSPANTPFTYPFTGVGTTTNAPWTGTPVGTWTPSKSWTSTATGASMINDYNLINTTSAGQFGNAQAVTGTTSPASVSSTNLDVQYCTQCKSVVESESHSCQP